MTLGGTLRRGRFLRAQVAVREPAGEASAEPVGGGQPEASAAGEAPSLRDWIGVLAMGTGLFMAIMDVQIVTSSLTQIQGGLSASIDERLTGCQCEPDRQAIGIDQRMNLAGQSTSLGSIGLMAIHSSSESS